VKHLLLPVLAIAMWIMSILWLIRYEVCPQFFTRSISGYDEMVRKEDLMRDSWVKILYNKKHIGYTHSTTEISNTDPSRYYAIMSSSMIRVEIMKIIHKVTINSSVFLDMAYNLNEFTFSLNSALYSAQATGQARPNGIFHIRVKHGDKIISRDIKIPPNALVHNPFPTTRARNMKPGDHLNTLVMNPFTLKNENVTIKALKTETITLDGTNYTATLLAMNHNNIETRNWIDSDGNILKQEMPFGLSFEKSSAENSSIPSQAINVDESFLKLVLLPALGGQ